MSYNITLTRNTVPSDNNKAWKYWEELQKQETDEQSEDFLDLIEKFKKKFPCICDLPDDEIDNGVWSDGPLSNNAGKNLTTLGIVFSAVENVMPFLVETANENNFVVFDHQSGKIFRPKSTANIIKENSKRFETVYKLRFLPLIITAIILIITVSLKYVFQIEVGKFFYWSILLTIAAFIYYRGVFQTKKEREEESKIDNEN